MTFSITTLILTTPCHCTVCHCIWVYSLIFCYAELRYGCHYAEFCYTECHSAECCYVECHNAEYRCAQLRCLLVMLAMVPSWVA